LTKIADVVEWGMATKPLSDMWQQGAQGEG
jgi:hypothetical protein